MIKNIQKLFKIAATLVIGSILLWSCEPDADQLGSQFFQNGATGIETQYPIIAYNAKNNDSIRTDAVRLQSATLGAFDEPQFGLQKSSYVSQVRLSAYEPDFGTNAALDSAVLVLQPLYAADSATTTTNEDYIYPKDSVPAKKVVSNYPVSKYGKTKIGSKTIFNIKVHEVSEFLGSSAAIVYSTKNVATAGEIGSKVFDGTISSIKITKDTDNSTLYERGITMRIPLDSTFFSNKIIKKPSTSPEFADAASFIRYFKGIKISVQENDGYIFSFDPNSVVINLYYKKDKVDSGVTTREEATFSLNLGSSNVHLNQINYTRTIPFTTALASSDEVNGDPQIFAQGMGGPGVGLRVPAATVSAIKDLYKNDKIGIISAKIRLYTDATDWNNAYKKPDYFVVRQRDLTPAPGTPEYLNDFLIDLSALAYTGKYNLVKAYDLDKNPAHYDIGITQTFKNIIETEAENHDLILNVGIYTTDTNGNLLGLQYPGYGSQNFNTRSYTPNRVILLGTGSGEKNAKLILTYGKK